MAIKDWPKGARPRERAQLHGIKVLSDTELLARFIGTGTKGHSAMDIAQQALLSKDSLADLALADLDTLTELPGLGSAKAILIKAALELANRVNYSQMQGRPLMADSAAVARFLIGEYKGQGHESFSCLYLDQGCRLIRFQHEFSGTLDSAHVYPRDILTRALALQARSVIFAHNHPGGQAKPSDADLRITQRLVEALALVDIDVLDHFLVADHQAISFASQGWLGRP